MTGPWWKGVGEVGETDRGGISEESEGWWGMGFGETAVDVALDGEGDTAAGGGGGGGGGGCGCREDAFRDLMASFSL